MEAPYDFELDRITSEIRRLGVRRVLLQLPSGFKPYASQLSSELKRKTGCEVWVSAGSCYGGCDLAVEEARRLQADLLVHFGHTSFLHHPDFRVLYVEAACKLEVEEAVRRAIPLLSPHVRIGLTASLQHVHKLGEVGKLLEGEGKQVEIGKPKGRGVNYPGQILGCNVSAAEAVKDRVEAYLHIGGGSFHALGVHLETGRPVVAADPLTGQAFQVRGEKVKARLRASLLRLGEASLVGVIVGVKPGQFNYQLALQVKARLEELGKHVLLLSLNEISEEMLGDFPSVEAFICTACPRIGLDDAERFSRPVIPAFKFLEFFGEPSHA